MNADFNTIFWHCEICSASMTLGNSTRGSSVCNIRLVALGGKQLLGLPGYRQRIAVEEGRRKYLLVREPLEPDLVVCPQFKIHEWDMSLDWESLDWKPPIRTDTDR